MSKDWVCLSELPDGAEDTVPVDHDCDRSACHIHNLNVTEGLMSISEDMLSAPEGEPALLDLLVRHAPVV